MNNHLDNSTVDCKPAAGLAQTQDVAVVLNTSSNGCCAANNLLQYETGLGNSKISTSLVVQRYENHSSNNNSHQQQQQKAQNKEEMAIKIAKSHKKWNKRLKILFCCLGYKKNKESIADVASIFAEFYADLKVPSSDIAAGFVLLSKYQSAQRQWIIKHHEEQQLGVEQYLSGVPIRMDTKFVDLSTADDSHLVNDLIYYLNYSLAIFGWPMHLVDDPCLFCCIYPYLKLSPCCSSSKSGSSSGSGNSSNSSSSSSSSSSGSNKHKRSKTKTQSSTNDQGDLKRQSTNKRSDQIDDESAKLETHSNVSDESNCSSQVHTSKIGQLNEDCDIPIILEDNCCNCNVASAQRRLAKHNYEIIYVSYKVNVNVVPFLVAADHSKRAIVVAIRGSMSLSDMVTDMNGQIDKVPIKDCPDDWLCHRGITRAAMYVKLTLERERIVERAFNCRPDLGSQDYTLVLCGHSLGAGAAAILGVLMRPQYPKLKAYLYSPPGGILSMPVVEYTKEFAVGVILGNDTVPRLGVAQLERLRYHTLLSIKSAQKSSGKILAKALCPTCCFGENEVEYDPIQSLDLLHGTEGRPFDYSGTKIPFQSQPQVLYVPGRLIHVVKNYSFHKSKNGANNGQQRQRKTSRLWGGPIYQAVWTDNAMYDRVLISEGMFFDHLPNKLMQAMKMLFSNTLPGRQSVDSNQSVICSEVTGSDDLPNQRPQTPLNLKEVELGATVALAKQLAEENMKIQAMSDYDNNNNQEDENNNNNVSQQADGKAFPNLNQIEQQL